MGARALGSVYLYLWVSRFRDNASVRVDVTPADHSPQTIHAEIPHNSAVRAVFLRIYAEAQRTSEQWFERDLR